MLKGGQGKEMIEPIFTPQITDDIVKLHHDYFVPAIYAQWAHHVIDLSAIELGFLDFIFLSIFSFLITFLYDRN